MDLEAVRRAAAELISAAEEWVSAAEEWEQGNSRVEWAEDDLKSAEKDGEKAPFESWAGSEQDRALKELQEASGDRVMLRGSMDEAADKVAEKWGAMMTVMKEALKAMEEVSGQDGSGS